MSFEHFTVKNGKTLRCGYTTGTCATAASTAAAKMLLSGKWVEKVHVETPAGIDIELEVLEITREENRVTCAIQKYSGDDPDITNGMLVFSTVELAEGIGEPDIFIDGGVGVGRVTKPGLDQPVGNAAINSTPRKMIREHLLRICGEEHYSGNLNVTIFIPQGEELAKKTFNSRMGILGGLSVLGTTGIVDPMSNKAMVQSNALEMKQYYPGSGGKLLMSPGNYGAHFVRDTLRLPMEKVLSCSNFIGDGIDSAVGVGFKKILLVGHIGKLVKLGIGITNTHSANGDGRIETLLSCAIAAGSDLATLQKINDCVSTDAALVHLGEAGILEKTMKILGDRIYDCLTRRIPEDVEIGYICFTNAEPYAGVLVQSENAEALMNLWRNENG